MIKEIEQFAFKYKTEYAFSLFARSNYDDKMFSRWLRKQKVFKDFVRWMKSDINNRRLVNEKLSNELHEAHKNPVYTMTDEIFVYMLILALAIRPNHEMRLYLEPICANIYPRIVRAFGNNKRIHA